MGKFVSYIYYIKEDKSAPSNPDQPTSNQKCVIVILTLTTSSAIWLLELILTISAENNLHCLTLSNVLIIKELCRHNCLYIFQNEDISNINVLLMYDQTNINVCKYNHTMLHSFYLLFCRLYIFTTVVTCFS